MIRTGLETRLSLTIKNEEMAQWVRAFSSQT